MFSNGARVCLDTGGRIAGALDDFVRRRTGSDDSTYNSLRVVTGQWGAREVPAGAAIPFMLRLLFLPSARVRDGQRSNSRRRHNSPGLKIPAGVMIPVIRSGGVTSNPGLNAELEGFATRT